VPKGYWSEEKHCSEFCEWATELLDLGHIKDLAMVPRQNIIKIGGSGLRGEFNLVDILKRLFPKSDWNPRKQTISQTQTLLQQTIKNCFPEEDIRTNFRHPELLFAASNKAMELDVFLPAQRLAFEYQVCFSNASSDQDRGIIITNGTIYMVLPTSSSSETWQKKGPARKLE
jgi:hypothetical protein